jgi:pimeloyl-ACP methyl ester carboxylesterase
MPTAAINGLSFDYSDEGPPDAPTCLLLHGFPQDRTSWDPIAAALVDHGFRVLRPDQRGYSPGARPESVAAYRLGELVSDAIIWGSTRPMSWVMTGVARSPGGWPPSIRIG